MNPFPLKHIAWYATINVKKHKAEISSENQTNCGGQAELIS